jgi:Uma2 family endonuclease
MSVQHHGANFMSTDHVRADPTGDVSVPVPVTRRRPDIELQNGDRMNREEFHRLYEQTSDGFKAELIGGIVYVASPCFLAHGKPHKLLTAVVAAYEAQTPGVDASDNTTILLGHEGEPQPDLYLRILPEYGGQSSTGYQECVEGAPELIIEVANTSRAIDLHAKKKDYGRYGVREYLVHCVKEKELRWFDLTAGTELQSDASGVCRIQNFAGLWINGPALFSHDYSSLMKALDEGLAAPEHAAFVRQLAERRKQT